MGRLRIGWAIGVVAPWCLGIGLGMSISADAGQEPVFGRSIAPLVHRAPDAPADLVPSQVGQGFFVAPAKRPAVQLASLQLASLDVGTPKDFAEMPDEIEPRKDLKRNAEQKLPDIDRTHKGNPFIGLRPSFDTRLRRPGALAALRADALVFVHDETLLSGEFSRDEGEYADPESVAHFEPWPDGEAPTTAHTYAGASPQQSGAAVVTMRPEAINERLMQGATPVVRRAAALASTTPAPADSHPVEVVALSNVRKSIGSTLSQPSSERPNYAAFIDQDPTGREKKCLAEAIYFEARSEPEEGQAAVAQVVLNRVSSGLYPASICGVVYQNRSHYHACQFSFACEGRSLRVTEPEAWRTAVRIANEVSEGKTYLADVGRATHYHANYVRPAWARRLERMDVIGHHVFYKLRPGQT